MNNLYGWSMIQKLPLNGFKWHKKQITVDDIKNYNDETSDKGYILECDLKYPKELHDLHNDYPLMPENIVIDNDMTSDYHDEMIKNIEELNDIKINKCSGIQKLVYNLNDKKKYVCHIRNLQYYLKKGVILEKIHRVIEFNQSNWMEPYIMFNTNQRKNAKNDFEKDFYKLMNNSVFGKTMENIRNRKDIKLIFDENKAQKIFNSNLFKNHNRITDDLILIEQYKKYVKLDKPIIVGMTILDLAKYKMYDYWYDHLKVKYGDKIKLIYTDTDSLIFDVETEDYYDDMLQHKNLYDLSEYDENQVQVHFWTHLKKNKNGFVDPY